MIQKKFEKVPEFYSCHLCDYNTCRKSQYERHLLTLKHINSENDTNYTKNVPKSSNIFECDCSYTINRIYIDIKKIVKNAI